MKSADISCRFFNNSGHFRSYQLKSFLNFGVGNTQGFQAAAVKFFSVVYERRVALGFDGINDFQNPASDFLVLTLVTLEKRIEIVNAFIICVSFHGDSP